MGKLRSGGKKFGGQSLPQYPVATGDELTKYRVTRKSTQPVNVEPAESLSAEPPSQNPVLQPEERPTFSEDNALSGELAPVTTPEPPTIQDTLTGSALEAWTVAPAPDGPAPATKQDDIRWWPDEGMKSAEGLREIQTRSKSQPVDSAHPHNFDAFGTLAPVAENTTKSVPDLHDKAEKVVADQLNLPGHWATKVTERQGVDDIVAAAPISPSTDSVGSSTDGNAPPTQGAWTENRGDPNSYRPADTQVPPVSEEGNRIELAQNPKLESDAPAANPAVLGDSRAEIENREIRIEQTTGKESRKIHSGKSAETGSRTKRSRRKGEGLTQSHNDGQIAPTFARDGEVGQEMAGYRISQQLFDYILAIETIKKEKLPIVQLSDLFAKHLSHTFRRLGRSAARRHTNKFTTKVRQDEVEEWERQTALKWPTYEKDVFNEDGKRIRKRGDLYDAHHIFVQKYGGPHTWSNLTPMRCPEEHQGGIHIHPATKLLFP